LLVAAKVKLYFLCPADVDDDDKLQDAAEDLVSSMSPRPSSNDSDDASNMIVFDPADGESAAEDDDSLSDTDDDDTPWSQA